MGINISVSPLTDLPTPDPDHDRIIPFMAKLCITILPYTLLWTCEDLETQIVTHQLSCECDPGWGITTRIPGKYELNYDWLMDRCPLSPVLAEQCPMTTVAEEENPAEILRAPIWRGVVNGFYTHLKRV